MALDFMDMSEMENTAERALRYKSAKLGLEIARFTTRYWTVCSICDGMSGSICGVSACCGGIMRIQGWSL